MISDDTFWLFAIALFIIDHIKLIDNREMLLVEGIGGQWIPRLAYVPFEVRNRSMVILNPVTPFLMAFKMTWAVSDGDNSRSMRADKFTIRRLQREVFGFRFLATAGFILLFGFGPYLTKTGGLAYALLSIAPIYGALALGVQVLALRNSLGLSKSYWLKFFLETIICPVYFPTLLKRVSWHTALQSNGIEFSRRYCERSEEFESAVSARSDRGGLDQSDFDNENDGTTS